MSGLMPLPANVRNARSINVDVPFTGFLVKLVELEQAVILNGQHEAG